MSAVCLANCCLVALGIAWCITLQVAVFNMHSSEGCRFWGPKQLALLLHCFYIVLFFVCGSLPLLLLALLLLSTMIRGCCTGTWILGCFAVSYFGAFVCLCSTSITMHTVAGLLCVLSTLEYFTCYHCSAPGLCYWCRAYVCTRPGAAACH